MKRVFLQNTSRLPERFDGRAVLTGIDPDPGPRTTVAFVRRSRRGKPARLRVLASLEQGSGGNLTPAGQHIPGSDFTADRRVIL